MRKTRYTFTLASEMIIVDQLNHLVFQQKSPANCIPPASPPDREYAGIQQSEALHHLPWTLPVWHDNNALRTGNIARKHFSGSGDLPHIYNHCRST